MKDENEISLPNFHPGASYLVRRRFYVATVIGLAIFFASLISWPLSAKNFRCSAVVTVQVSPQAIADNAKSRSGAALNAHIENNLSPSFASTGTASTETVSTGTVSSGNRFIATPQHSDPGAAVRPAVPGDLRRLQEAISQVLSDEVLAECIRIAAQRIHRPDGMAPIQIPDLRQSLEVKIAAAGPRESAVFQISIARTGDAWWLNKPLVDAIAQTLSHRLSRQMDLSGVQQQLKNQVDLVAAADRQWAANLVPIVQQSWHLHRQHQNQLQTLLQELEQGSRTSSATMQANQTEIQNQILAVQQQVLTSDVQLLNYFRQQVIAHFEVDETDALVQNLERLIGDRRAVMQEMAASERPDLSDEGRVKANPFMSASFQKSKPATAPTLDFSRIQASVADLDRSVQLLDDLQRTLQRPREHAMPTLQLSSELEKQASPYVILNLSPAKAPLPMDIVPNQRWLLGASLISVFIGLAFAIQYAPHRLSQKIFTPKQLSEYLDVPLLGSVLTERQKPKWVEQIFMQSGVIFFRASELMVLLVLCGLIVAMVWDNQLPGLLASEPLQGFCQAVWVLFGR